MKAISKAGEQVKEPWWVEYARSFFPILLIVLILRSFLVEPFRIPSGSMRPTLLEGDFIVVNKYAYGLRLPGSGTKVFSVGDPKRGDVIVFKHDKNGESMDMIKRVVGLPGDHIQYKNQTIYINDVPVKKDFKMEKEDSDMHGMKTLVREFTEQLGDVKHPIFVHANPSLFSHYPYDDVIVPAGSYFAMGDNRDNSGDSRVWGFVKDEDIQGRAFGVWMSWDSLENSWLPWNKIRWHRLMTGIP